MGQKQLQTASNTSKKGQTLTDEQLALKLCGDIFYLISTSVTHADHPAAEWLDTFSMHFHQAAGVPHDLRTLRQSALDENDMLWCFLSVYYLNEREAVGTIVDRYLSHSWSTKDWVAQINAVETLSDIMTLYRKQGNKRECAKVWGRFPHRFIKNICVFFGTCCLDFDAIGEQSYTTMSVFLSLGTAFVRQIAQSQ